MIQIKNDFFTAESETVRVSGSVRLFSSIVIFLSLAGFIIMFSRNERPVSLVRYFDITVKLSKIIFLNLLAKMISGFGSICRS